MKKLLSLSAILFTLTTIAQTNLYHPFPDSNAVWNEENSHYNGCSIFTDFQETYSYIISGDTTISASQYQKVIIPYVVSNCSSLYMHHAGYAGAIRQDTSIRKIFIVPPGNITEVLLYDFELQMGDTVNGFLVANTMCLPAAIVVTAIDSILVNGTYRKRWLTNSYAQFIEGIGSTTGLLEHICEIIDGPNSNLKCFKQNGIPMYPDFVAQCDIIDVISHFPEGKVYFSVSPNPFHSSTMLQVTSEFANAKLKIYASIGGVVREESIPNQMTFVLNRNELRDGIYFLQLINEEGQMISDKLIVK